MTTLTSDTLSFLPQTCSLNNLSRIFGTYLAQLVQLNNNVAKVIERFIKDQDAGAKPITCGIIFADEAVPVTNGVVSPADVVLAISKSLDVMSAGKGIDPGFSMGNDTALNISYSNNITLHVTPDAVHPAFNWNDLDIKTSDLQIVRNWIVEGRSKIKAKSRPGLVTV